MLDKIKNIFTNKEKRIENLISLLIILIITLVVINKILEEDEKESNDYKNEIGVELAVQESDNISTDLEKRLENILEKISGVGKVSVLLTYKESGSLVPIYNVNSSISTVEEKDTSGGSRITETENLQKDVVTGANTEIITEKNIMPIVEGAIIAAQGAENVNVKSNIIAAVEAVTGIATHKIQVFEMEDDEF
ncbi:MAG: hypothetical protein IKL55_07180 [Clostridia bacterium]|nr:hypothetical protein [Clostridia bacterium]